MFFLERLVDRILYRGLRTFDQFVALVYSYAPIGLLRKYRESKRHPSVQDSSKPVAEKELVGAPEN